MCSNTGLYCRWKICGKDWNFMVVQWLGPSAFTSGAQVQSLVEELRPCKLCSQNKKNGFYSVPLARAGFQISGSKLPVVDMCSLALAGLLMSVPPCIVLESTKDLDCCSDWAIRQNIKNKTSKTEKTGNSFSAVPFVQVLIPL